MSSAHLIFGCANVGSKFTSKEDVSTVLKALKIARIGHIDTAARYPPGNPGLSQKLLGEAQVAEKNFIIDTKILIGADSAGSLSAAAIKKSLEESLASLNVPKVNVLYCHGPDEATPIEEQAAAFDKHYKLGRFHQLGVSNFTTEMIERWINISNDKGYVKPSVYQGQYNLFCRGYEEDLFPILRKHGMHFMAFSPLAGGFLTGKLTPAATADDLTGTRFEASNPMGRAYRHWYDKPGMYKGLDMLLELCKQYKIPMEEAALRWIVYNSSLGEGDGVILGASKIAQIEVNAEEISHGPLPEELVESLNALWEVVKRDAPATNVSG